MKNDPGLYDYWPYVGRPKLTWPGGARVFEGGSHCYGQFGQ